MFGSAAAPIDGAGDVHLGLEDATRYVDGGLLGEGGMGRVYSCWDQRLRRTVARKEVQPGSAAAARLAREAWVTAGLEHPGIVTVLDAGVTDAGQPWYTMPLVRGRALSDLIRSASTLTDRLALVRHFHAATEAMAYAHSQGVIHRDLKPDNILVGAFGDTLVVDWGLARPLDGEDLARGPLGPVVDEAFHTRIGSVLGTPAYMSPEQARGEPADRRSDVWGLGMVLAEILSGAPVLAGTSQDVLDRVGRAAVRCDVEGPPELRAVVQCCLAAEPDERYPDAAALAADVLAWLEGRRVDAHVYSATELGRRALWAWRWPLTLAATIGTVALGSVVVGGAILADERDRARAAERRALASEAAARRSLADALLSAAQPAALALDVPRAEQLASQALAATDDDVLRARAAGILAGFPPERPVPLASVHCPEAVATAAGDLYCLERDPTVVSRRPRTDDHAVAWRRTFDQDRAYGMVVAGDGVILRVPPHNIALHPDGSEAPPPTESFRILGSVARAVAMVDREHLEHPADRRPLASNCRPPVQAGSDGVWTAVLCSDGWLESGGRRWDTGVRRAALGFDVLDGTAAIAATGGQITRVDLSTGAVDVSTIPLEGPDEVVLGSGIVGIDGPSEGPLLLDPDLAPRIRLPEDHRLLWVDLDHALTRSHDVVTFWRLPRTEPLRLPMSAGLSGLIGDEGALWATTGDGHVSRWTPGEPLTTRRLSNDVLKPVQPAQDGAWVLDHAANAPLRLLDAGLRTVRERPHGIVRRLFGNRDVLWHLSMGGGVYREGELRLDETCFDGVVHDGVAWVACETGLRSIGPEGAQGVLLDEPVHRVARIGDDWVVAGDRRVRWRDVDRDVPQAVTSLAATDRFVAAGLVDGSVRVWEADGRLRFVMRGHSERVSGIVLTDDRMWTAGWDAIVRSWWLDRPEETPETVAAAWTPPDPS
jgi:hypothetical protein